MDSIEALSADINTALKIARVCFSELGFKACICNVVNMLKPAWINNLPSPQERCKGGNIFGLLVRRIVQLIARLADDALNDLVIDPFNDMVEGVTSLSGGLFGRRLGWRPIPKACISGPFNPPFYDCNYGSVDNTELLGCYDSRSKAAQNQCFFTRQRTICMDDGDRYQRYQDLFTAPDAEELDAQYKEIVGDSYEFLAPSFKSLMTQVADQAQSEDVTQAMNLCDASLYESMDLDEIIVVCIFTFVESFCPSSDSSEKFEAFLNAEAVWKLPTVVFDWKAR